MSALTTVGTAQASIQCYWVVSRIPHKLRKRGFRGLWTSTVTFHSYDGTHRKKQRTSIYNEVILAYTGASTQGKMKGREGAGVTAGRQRRNAARCQPFQSQDVTKNL